MMASKYIFTFLIFLSIIFSNYANADWVLHNDYDNFTNLDKSTAWLESKNSQQVGIRGKATKAILVAFKSPDQNTAAGKIWFGDGVMPVGLSNSSGTCHYESCIMMVRFDDKKIIEYDVYQASLGTNSGQLIINSKEFFEKAFAAKKNNNKSKIFQSR